MKRNDSHEAQVMMLSASIDAPRAKIKHIMEADAEFAIDAEMTPLTENDIWHAINMLIDTGAVTKASNTADWFRITFAGYAAYADEI